MSLIVIGSFQQSLWDKAKPDRVETVLIQGYYMFYFLSRWRGEVLKVLKTVMKLES